MHQPTTLEKIQKGKPLTDSPALRKFRQQVSPLLLRAAEAAMGYKLECINRPCPIPGKPIIFASNHSGPQDTVMVMRASGIHSYILSGTQKLLPVDHLFFCINGTIWVDRQNKADMSAVKGALHQQLMRGNNIMWFPEGTWNLTPDLLMLPMRWGIIETARNAGAQILPMALDYDRDQKICRAKFAAPMADEALASNPEGITHLRDTMATLRWDLMQKSQPITHRSQVTPEQLEAEMQRPLQEYPTLDWDYESSIIYKPQNVCRPKEAFNFLNRLQPGKEKAFLAREQLEYRNQFG